jgi:uncharacterized membrane protein
VLEFYKKLKLGMIGFINALAFIFLPPLLSFRPAGGVSISTENDEIVSGGDISTTLGSTNGNWAILLVVTMILGFVGYLNFRFIKKTLCLNRQELKFRYSIIPFGCWLLIVVLILSTGLFRRYMIFVVNDSGSLFGGSFISLAFLALVLLDGIVVLSSSFMAFFAQRKI